MKHPRLTIAHLILVVLVAAIGLAAIRSGAPAWSGAMISITFFTMTCSALGVAFARGPRRVYWIGFATLGWTYLILCSFLPQTWVSVGSELLGRKLFLELYPVLHPDPQAVAATAPIGGLQSVPASSLGAATTGGGFGGPAPPVPPPNPVDVGDFLRIGVAMEALLWAFLGGWAARYFASGREPPAPNA